MNGPSSAAGWRAPPSHQTLKSLLGAWALSACSTEETLALEEHLTDCAGCADEAVRLRNAVGLLRQDDALDLDPLLRVQVLTGCLERRPARIPLPRWAGPYDAETARLDALLRDLDAEDWTAPVTMRWHDGARQATVADVLGHLTAVDSLMAAALGMPEPLGPQAPVDPATRTQEYWRRFAAPGPGVERERWRQQGRALLRTVSLVGGGSGRITVDYGDFALPVRDAFLDRAMECWIHAGDIADAVAYPYEPPVPEHLRSMIDLVARLLPDALANRRRAGLASSPGRLVAAGAPGRSLHLEVEGAGGGDWYISLDSPGAHGSAKQSVAHVALEGPEFCRLAAGRRRPGDLAVGQEGDRAAIHDVLCAAAGLSRL